MISTELAIHFLELTLIDAQMLAAFLETNVKSGNARESDLIDLKVARDNVAGIIRRIESIKEMSQFEKETA
jgi:hypothetical protein